VFQSSVTIDLATVQEGSRYWVPTVDSDNTEDIRNLMAEDPQFPVVKRLLQSEIGVSNCLISLRTAFHGVITRQTTPKKTSERSAFLSERRLTIIILDSKSFLKSVNSWFRNPSRQVSSRTITPTQHVAGL
jgi:hypothetical protein